MKLMKLSMTNTIDQKIKKKDSGEWRTLRIKAALHIFS